MKQPLQYAPALPAGRRRWARRAAAVVLLALAAGSAIKGWPPVWRQARILYWQRQCGRYSPPAGQLASVEPLPYAGIAPPFTYAAADPPCVTALGPFVASEWPWPRAAGPVLFLHDRRTPAGTRRLVILRRTPPGLRQSWDIPLSFTATLVDPAGIWSRPIGPTTVLPDVIPPAFGDDRPVDGLSTGPTLRLYAGQADAADESHFTLDYDLDGRRGTIDGWLQDRPDAGAGNTNPRVDLRMGSRERD